jgi:DNA-binding transcriptional regulator YiaG
MNGIRHDNRVDNLEWVTMSENQLHSYRVLNRDARGEKNSCAKLKNENVLWIRENYPNRKSLNLTRKKIAEMFGISEGTLKQVISRKKWKHI